jgi:hypothetical protein
MLEKGLISGVEGLGKSHQYSLFKECGMTCERFTGFPTFMTYVRYIHLHKVM